MNYEIIVSNKGHHYFTVKDLNCSHARAKEMARDLQTRFPSFTVTLRERLTTINSITF